MAHNPTGDDSRTASEKLRDLPIGRFVTLKKIEQGGALQARRLSTGTVQFYWRYTHNGKSDRVPVGTHDAAAPPRSLSPSPRGFSVAAAVEACRSKALIQLQQQAVGGYREHVAALKRNHDAAKEKKRQVAEQTLEKLLDVYCDHLEALGRRSHSDARSIFRLHLKVKWPELAGTAAAHVTAEQVFTSLTPPLAVKDSAAAKVVWVSAFVALSTHASCRASEVIAPRGLVRRTAFAAGAGRVLVRVRPATYGLTSS